MVDSLPTSKCTKCGAVTIKRVARPVRCPRCGGLYSYDEEQTEEQESEV